MKVGGRDKKKFDQVQLAKIFIYIRGPIRASVEILEFIQLQSGGKAAFARLGRTLFAPRQGFRTH